MQKHIGFSVALLLLAGLLPATGNARLPPRPELPEQLAAPSGDTTKLDNNIARLQLAHPGESGFHLVPNGVEAFALRGLSARTAERSLDVQYYLWHNDLTGRLLARELLAAADRGVHVRILLDDMAARADNVAMASLDAHPDIEIRVFNPFSSRKGSASKTFELMTNFSRINHRMHNKAWIADNRLAIAGGRNIGDEYFTASEHVNFLDLDLAFVGPAVQQMSASFDQYWNSTAVWPIQTLSPKLVTQENLAALRVKAEADAAVAAQSDWVKALTDSSVVANIQSGALELNWTPDWQVLSDDPLKAMLADNAMARSNVLRGLTDAMQAAKTSITLISPYFVPGKGGTTFFTSLAQSDRHVAILTNSLAANDVAAVHGGYSKYRKGLLKGGISLWELKPRAGEKAKSSAFGSSGASLHTKAGIFDGSSVFVGSFNLDPRSVSLNCEQGILVNNAAMSAQLDAMFAKVTDGENSWRVTMDDKDKLHWTDGTQTFNRDPDAKFSKRVLAKLLYWLPFDKQL